MKKIILSLLLLAFVAAVFAGAFMVASGPASAELAANGPNDPPGDGNPGSGAGNQGGGSGTAPGPGGPG